MPQHNTTSHQHHHQQHQQHQQNIKQKFQWIKLFKPMKVNENEIVNNWLGENEVFFSSMLTTKSIQQNK